MRIITLECPECGTVVAANELEDNRVMKCPEYRCESILRFEHLSEEDQSFYLENKSQYEV